MPFDQTTLDAIKAITAEPFQLAVAPRASGVAIVARSGDAEGLGDTEAEAMDNLLLVAQGRSDEVAAATRLKIAQAAEAEAYAALVDATAERVLVETEIATIVEEAVVEP